MTDRTSKRLDELETMTDGWWQGAGIAPSKALLDRARAAMDGLIAATWGVEPFIYPTPHGGLQLEWDVAGYAIEIEMNDPPSRWWAGHGLYSAHGGWTRRSVIVWLANEVNYHWYTWWVSVSRNGKRCSDRDLTRTRIAFGMQQAEEDNHYPGVARHLVMPVDPQYRVDCECKDTEMVVVEADGYTWTTPKSGECRGCWFEGSTGRACPLHGVP